MRRHVKGAQVVVSAEQRALLLRVSQLKSQIKALNSPSTFVAMAKTQRLLITQEEELKQLQSREKQQADSRTSERLLAKLQCLPLDATLLLALWLWRGSQPVAT